MTWTAQQYLDAVADALDALGSSRWDKTFATGVVMKNALTGVFRQEWGRLLESTPAYRFQRLTVATDANGQIPLANLSTGAADAQKRFFRVIGRYLYAGVMRYELVSPQDHAYLLGQPTQSGSVMARMWWREDAALQTLPAQAGVSFSLPVAHLPTAFGALTAGTATVEWPDDYELIPVFMTAALLFSKGDAEVGGTADFAKIASALRDGMLSEVAKITSESPMIRAGDSPADWGS